MVSDCPVTSRRWDILAIPSVEIPRLPKDAIDLAARTAETIGAKLANMPVETIAEAVGPGINWAILNSTSVDLIAHPGSFRWAKPAWLVKPQHLP